MVQFIPEAGTLETSRRFSGLTAGAESNVAIALAGLGASAAWVSRVGDDGFGRRITREIASHGVDVAQVTIDATRPTGVLFKQPAGEQRSVTYYRAGSAASAMGTSDAVRAIGAHPRVLHTTGITVALSSTCDEAVSFAVRELANSLTRVSFDVNYRRSLWPEIAQAASRLAALASAADIAFVGLDEARELWGAASVRDVRQVLQTETLVVKHAPNGVTMFSGSEPIQLDLPVVDVVEAVGAGDAFAAGVLFGVLQGWPPMRQLRAGHVLAAAVLGSISDQSSSVSKQKLERRTEDVVWQR